MNVLSTYIIMCHSFGNLPAEGFGCHPQDRRVGRGSRGGRAELSPGHPAHSAFLAALCEAQIQKPTPPGGPVEKRSNPESSPGAKKEDQCLPSRISASQESSQKPRDRPKQRAPCLSNARSDRTWNSFLLENEDFC